MKYNSYVISHFRSKEPMRHTSHVWEMYTGFICIACMGKLCTSNKPNTLIQVFDLAI